MSLINKTVMAVLSPLLRSFDRGCEHPGAVQENVFRELLSAGCETAFGKEHGFGRIKDYADYRRLVPVREYNGFAPYIERLRRGENYVLWNQKVKWFAKSSGTSSDKSKYIPVTPANLSGCHYRGFKTMLATYIRRYPLGRRRQERGLVGHPAEQQPVRGRDRAHPVAGHRHAAGFQAEDRGYLPGVLEAERD